MQIYFLILIWEIHFWVLFVFFDSFWKKNLDGYISIKKRSLHYFVSSFADAFKIDQNIRIIKVKNIILAVLRRTAS